MVIMPAVSSGAAPLSINCATTLVVRVKASASSSTEFFRDKSAVRKTGSLCSSRAMSFCVTMPVTVPSSTTGRWWILRSDMSMRASMAKDSELSVNSFVVMTSETGQVVSMPSATTRPRISRSVIMPKRVSRSSTSNEETLYSSMRCAASRMLKSGGHERGLAIFTSWMCVLNTLVFAPALVISSAAARMRRDCEE